MTDESIRKLVAHNPKRLATSEDIPRAVEKLLQWIVRLGSYGLATLCAGLAIAGFAWNWPRWLAVTFAVVSVAAVVAGRVCGGPCPLVFTAPEKGHPQAPANADDSATPAEPVPDQ
jgi:hypothetical protein